MGTTFTSSLTFMTSGVLALWPALDVDCTAVVTALSTPFSVDTNAEAGVEADSATAACKMDLSSEISCTCALKRKHTTYMQC